MWDAGESIGLAVKQTKQNIGCQSEDYWSAIYNLYGDPKFGWQGPPAGAGSAPRLKQGEPPSSANVVIPDYLVNRIEGEDYVEIPGGHIMSVPNKPAVPYYRVFYDYPQGYQIQDVTITNRSEPITSTSLNIPNCPLGQPGQSASAQLQQSQSQEWWPEKDFEWNVQENPDGITLAITIYPFFYNPLTTNYQFYKNYTFNIVHTVSNIRITKLAINTPHYALDRTTGYIEFSDGAEGGIPQAGTDIVVEASFKKMGSNEIIGSVPLRTLKNIRGRTSCSFDWSSEGGIPPGSLVEVVLRDTAGNLLASKIEMLGQAPILDITEYSISPQQCKTGDSVNVNMRLKNNDNSSTFSGTAVIQVRNNAGETIQEFDHQFTDLAPGGTLSVEDAWSTSGAGEGTYHIMGYASYGNNSVLPRIAEVNVGVSLTLIGAIWQNPPSCNGRMVRLSGQYRGWEAGYGSPPVTRSDWVLSDGTGSIYVSGNSLGLRYPDDLAKPVTVDGVVRLKNAQPYIEIAVMPPRVLTIGATNRTASGARLNGSLSSLGSTATANISFQWGTNPGKYTDETTPAAINIARDFSFDLDGLVPGKTYYFRAKAAGAGTVYGAEMTFATLKQFSLAIAVVGNGNTSPLAGTYTYMEGAGVSITAVPSAGWVFSHWSGDANASFNPVAVTMNSSKRIIANFVLQGTTIAGIRANPAGYEGQAVKISGEYRGLEGGHGSPPVTRNDWVLRDNTGYIYINGSSLGLTYPGDFGKQVTVNGVVRLKNGQPYIEIPRK